MTERDPSPSEILSQMLSEAPDDAVGVWRVRVPVPPPEIARRPPLFAVAVETARQGLQAASAAGGGPQMDALSKLLTAALVRHEVGDCGCGPTSAFRNVDPICLHAQELASAIAGS